MTVGKEVIQMTCKYRRTEVTDEGRKQMKEEKTGDAATKERSLGKEKVKWSFIRARVRWVHQARDGDRTKDF